MANKRKIAGKLLVAAACAATLAQVPLSSASAYSVTYNTIFRTTQDKGNVNSNAAIDGVVTSDGAFVVVGNAETAGSADQAYATKFSKDGSVIWSKYYGTKGLISYAEKVVELPSGNYLISARLDSTKSAGSDKTTLIEVNKDTGEVVTSTEQNFRYNSIAVNDNVANGYVWAVVDDDIHILENTDDNGFSLIVSMNDVGEGVTINKIRTVEKDGFIALGYDETNESTVIYRMSANQTSPVAKTFSARGTIINDIMVGSDGKYIGVGSESTNSTDGYNPVVYKIDPSTGNSINRSALGGNLDTGKNSYFTSVDALSNGEIVVAGISGYTTNGYFTSGNPNDGISVRYSSNLDRLEIDSDFAGNSSFEALNVIRADGNNYYVLGYSGSSNIGINDNASEAYSVIARYEKGANVDVTFDIEGDIPDGVDVPDDGTYHWNPDGSNDLPHPGNTDDAIFSGWYTDEDLEHPADEGVPSDDVDLHGTYTEVGHDIVDAQRDTMCKTSGSKTVCTSPETIEVVEGETSDSIKPQVPSNLNTDGLTGKWVSDDESIATVDQFGRVTGVSEGTTNIRYVLMDEDGNIIYEYVMLITVKGAVNPDTFDKGTVSAFTAAGAAIGGLTAIFATVRRFFGRK